MPAPVATVATRTARGAALAPELARILAPDRVSTTLPDRTAYARDLWPRGLLGVRAGELAPHPPDVICWPTTVAEVQEVVRLAVARRVPIVPFGAGSGVCGGTLPLHGGIVVDLKRMRRLVSLDAEHLTATFETGILGDHLEHELARHGFTLGHFPSSIMCSTLGGWLAARSAGQLSSRYGKIEDMVRGVALVTGTGEVVTTSRASAMGAGPDLTPLLLGSEGTLGLFTRAELAIRPRPEALHLGGFAFPRLAAGCEAMRRVMQRGLRPSVLRLYDELDTMVALRGGRKDDPVPGGGKRDEPAHGPRDGGDGVGVAGGGGGGLLGDDGVVSPEEGSALDEWLKTLGVDTTDRVLPDLRRWLVGAALDRTAFLNKVVSRVLPRLGMGCLLIAGVEGDRDLARAEWRAVERELIAAGGRNLGPGPGEHWYKKRYAVSFKLSKVFDAGAFADTMEVATTWDRLLDLYRAVREAVAPHAFVMAHFSHAYPDGCSIYFSFAAGVPAGGGAAAEQAAAERRYDALWRAGLGAVTSVGATVSHHHGVGLLKAPFMEREHGGGMALFRTLKGVLDPHGILNPGKLGLDVDGDGATAGGGVT